MADKRAGTQRWIGVLTVVAAMLAAGAVRAEEIQITLRPSGAQVPSSVSLGQGANLPLVRRDAESGHFTTTLNVDHREIRVYTLLLEYGERTFALPLRLHRNSPPVNVAFRFDGPPHCLEREVRRAETRAQAGNIPQALERYLLARHLSEIDAEASRCRGGQVSRLERARIERGIQLATFGGSPFGPPESDPADWTRILGSNNARVYRRQVVQREAIILTQARDAVAREGDYAEAAEVNAELLSQAAQSDETSEILSGVGLTAERLETDQAYLEARARIVAEEQVSEEEEVPEVDIEPAPEVGPAAAPE